MILDEFTSLVGHDFTVDCIPDPITVRLTEASSLRPNGATGRPPFILVFRSDPDVLLLAGSYRMQAEGFGPDLIHLSDMAPPPNAEAGYSYQAVFN